MYDLHSILKYILGHLKIQYSVHFRRQNLACLPFRNEQATSSSFFIDLKNIKNTK